MSETDVRLGGRWTRGQRLKNALIRRAVRIALAVVDRFPERALIAMGRALGWSMFVFARRARRTAIENLERAGLDAERLAHESFVAAGESLAVSLLLRRPGFRALDRLIVPEADRRALETALDDDRGAIVVSAHLGAFELLPAAVAELGLKPAIVVRESYDPKLDSVVDAHRIARGIVVIHRGRPGSATRIVRALRQGRPVGVLPDLGGRVPSIGVEFLGARLGFPTGPARLALATGAPVVAATVVPIGAGRYRLEVRAVGIEPDRSDETAMTQRVANVLDAAIRACPRGWLWMAPRPAWEPRL